MQGMGKTTKQQQSAPEKLPATTSQAQAPCSGQSETKDVFSGHFTPFSFLLIRRRGKKCEVNPDNFVILGFTSGEISPFPSPSLH